MDCYKIGLFQQVLQLVCLMYGILLRYLRQDVRIVGNHLQSKRCRTLCHFSPDTAHTNDAKGLSGNLYAYKFLAFPLARLKRLVCLRQFSGKGKYEPNGMLSGRNRVAPGGVDRKSTRLNSSHSSISYAVFCLKKK